MNIKIKTTLIILMTFIIGMVTGGLITHAFLKYRTEKVLSMRAPWGFAAHFERIIQPTDEQREAIRKILYKYGEKMSEVRTKVRQEFLPISQAMQEELYAILTPEQKKRLEERFFRRVPGEFFPPPGDRPPGPWRKKFRDRDRNTIGPPWLKGPPGKEKDKRGEEEKDRKQ